MSLLDTITKGRRPRYIWALIYGTDGVGKSTMCSHAPNPIFVGAEKGTEQLDVARFPQVESISELFAQLRTLQLEKHDFQTVVLELNRLHQYRQPPKGGVITSLISCRPDSRMSP
jgi:AAA domain